MRGAGPAPGEAAPKLARETKKQERRPVLSHLLPTVARPQPTYCYSAPEPYGHPHPEGQVPSLSAQLQTGSDL